MFFCYYASDENQFFSNKITVFSAVFFLALVGCNNKTTKTHTSGFFKYIYLCENSEYQNKNDKSIVITGFTELGLKQERLDIPREIDGQRVKYLGLSDENFSHNNNRKITCGDHLKKIFVFDSLEHIEYMDCPSVDIMVCSSELSVTTFSSNFRHLYLYAPLFKDKGYLPDNDYSKTVQAANVSFLLNYDTGKDSNLYRVDNVAEGEKIVMPPKPFREKCLFTGWYTEPECLNAWDFNTTPSIERNNELVLYANWDI